MEKEEKLVKINCLLKGQIAEKFLQIKKRKGLTNNTEVIRLTIIEFYSAMVKAEGA